MRARFIVVLLLFFPIIASATTANDYTVDSMMGNLIIFFKVLVGIFWNTKALIGIIVLITSWAGWFYHNSRDGNSEMSMLYPLVGTLVSSLLITYGVATQTSDLFGIDDGVTIDQFNDGRANLSKMAEYKFIQGTKTGK